MSTKTQQKSAPSQSSQVGSGPEQGPTDFGSNDAMQEAMQASAKGPMKASVVQVGRHGDSNAKVLVARGKKHGVEEGWEARSGGAFGYVQRVFPSRCNVILYADENMDGEKVMPQVGRTVTIYRRPAP